MIQHLPQSGLHEGRDADSVHDTITVNGSFLDYLYGSHFAVNSAHHQAVDMPGQGISYVQYADDVPEALIHRYLPIVGVQWHPERMCFAHKREDTVDGSTLLRYFLSFTKKSKIF